MQKTILVITFLILPMLGFSQQVEADNYDSELIWGINKNTSGGLIGGFVARKSRRLSDLWFETFGIELVNVKHQQEIRRNSITGNFFIYGKSNYLYSIRGQYGRELILFKKAPTSGVEIKALGAIGPSFGIMAPYYIEFAPNRSASFSQSEQYDPNNEDHSIDQILGTGRLFEGLFQSKFRIGANAKVGMSFELGTIKSNVTGFEIGCLVDAYAGKITLLPTAENHSVFPTAYITLYYGSRR